MSILEQATYNTASTSHKVHLKNVAHGIALLRNDYGHEPAEPANQFCKHCNAALFTQEYKTPCAV